MGTHFVQEGEDHQCKAACYRISKDHISVLCDAGHSVNMRMLNDSTFGGSAFEASLNRLPVNAPFILV